MKNTFSTSGTSPMLDPKSDSLAGPPSVNPSSIESRIDPARLARILRRRLQDRHAAGTRIRQILDALTDEKVVAHYFAHAPAAQRAAKDEAWRRHRSAAYITVVVD